MVFPRAYGRCVVARSGYSSDQDTERPVAYHDTVAAYAGTDLCRRPVLARGGTEKYAVCCQPGDRQAFEHDGRPRGRVVNGNGRRGTSAVGSIRKEDRARRWNRNPDHQYARRGALCERSRQAGDYLSPYRSVLLSVPRDRPGAVFNQKCFHTGSQ